MARRRRRRPWYRRRAYRLTRTAVLAAALVVVGVRCDHERAVPGYPEASEVQSAGTGSGAGGAGADSRPGTTDPGAAAREASPPQPTRSETEVPPASAAGSPSPPLPSPGDKGKAAKRPASPRPLPRSRATRLVIPYIGVDATLIDLRLDSERRLPAPPESEPEVAGWYADGPSPGEQGTAIAVGHLDTNTGPAVFGGLGELKRGKRIEVRRADGRSAVYKVDAIKSYEKDKFPNREVYGARSRPELRLITCGGNYDRRTGYSGNLVVFAHLTATREPRATADKR